MGNDRQQIDLAGGQNRVASRFSLSALSPRSFGNAVGAAQHLQ
jgi:hypothetical protein